MSWYFLSYICMQFSRYIKMWENLFSRFTFLFWLMFYQSVEITRFELVTSCLQGRRSPNWAIPPKVLYKVGLSGLEPPTSRLSGVRSNRLSYKPSYFSLKFGSHLLSHTVTSAVPSAAWVLTIVFGMGTGVTPKRIATEKFCVHLCFKNTHN